jgi:hypothetical protein
MRFNTVLLLFSPCIITAGTYFASIGVRGFLKRHAFFVSARQFMWILLLCYAPQAINVVTTLITLRAGWLDPTLLIFQFFNILVLLFLVVMLWRQFNGYLAFGVTDELFRAAMLAGLQRLNVTFQETFSQLVIPEKDLKLQVAVAGWVGSAQVRIKHGSDRAFVGQLMHEMNQYFEHTTERPSTVAFTTYLVLGVLGVGMGIFFLILGFAA